MKKKEVLPIKILIVGSGAREHALTWKIAQSPRVDEIFVAPGNAGTSRIARNLDIKAEDVEAMVKASGDYKIDLAVIGPEVPLAEGIVDRLQEVGVPAFGPTGAAAQIESSKVFTKDLMHKYGIPCAASASFTGLNPAVEYVQKQRTPLWIKADGLAAGKGAILAESIPQSVDILRSLMEKKELGASGERVVIEENMTGLEMSSFVFSDGKTVLPFVDACDYKRIDDGDRGLNTGGMGSYSPPYFYDDVLGRKVMDTIMKPVIRAMETEGAPYKSVLFGGLMITGEGPKVIEFNCRFGDPEAQVMMRRLKTDLVEIILAVIEGNLDKIRIDLSKEACVGVVMASGGYPGTYQTGFPINGLDRLDDGIEVFHAGTKNGPDGEVLTGGGRVLTVTAMGKTLAEAREKVYANVSRIGFEGCHYRRDIALINR